MNETEQVYRSLEVRGEREPDYGKPLLVEWIDSQWFSVLLKIAGHQPMEAAA